MLFQIIKNLFIYLKKINKKVKKKSLDEFESLHKRLSDVDKNPVTNDEVEKLTKTLYKEYIQYINESQTYKKYNIPDLNNEKYYEIWKYSMGIDALREELPNDKLYYMIEIKRKALKQCLLKENYWRYN